MLKCVHRATDATCTIQEGAEIVGFQVIETDFWLLASLNHNNISRHSNNVSRHTVCMHMSSIHQIFRLELS